MNLLFTSAGRRDYLIEYFADALGSRGTIHIGNSEPSCSAFTLPFVRVVTPPIYDDRYIPFLFDYCRVHRIAAIIPLFDVDLPVLALARPKFAAIGTQVVVSDTAVVDVCNDKWRTAGFLRKIGLQGPLTFLSVEDALAAQARGETSFPLFVKPRWGMGSIAVSMAHEPEELGAVVRSVQRKLFATYLQYESAATPEHSVVIQEQAVGSEYGLDVLNDLSGKYQTTLVKKKLAMRAGETDVAVTVDEPVLREVGQRLAESLRHCGNLDVDLFFDGRTAYVLELNCRFGGGYPFSHVAGANFPAAIVAWLDGRKASSDWLHCRTGVTSVKAIRPIVLPQS